MAQPTYGAGFVDLSPRLSKGFGAELNKQATALGAGFAANFGLAIGGVAVGAAFAKGVSSAVSAAIDFESAFAGVAKTVDGTEAQLADLRQGIIDMSLAIPATTTEIAGVAEAAGQLGVATENIEDFTRVMIDLGNATNLSADQAADSLARFTNITGLPQEDFDRLGSTIVALGNNLAGTESEITELALRLAGAGTQIGLTEQDILGFAGALSSVGVNAEAGGTALSRVFVAIAQGVREGGDDLAEFASVAGLSSEEFAEAFEKDAAGAIVAFITGLDQLGKSGEDVFGVLKDLNLDDVRVQDAVLRLASAQDILTSALDLSDTAWAENTALTKEAAARYETTESKMKLLGNRMTEVGRNLGEDLLPSLVESGEALVTIIEKAEPFLKFGSSIARGLGYVADGVGPFSQAMEGIHQAVENNEDVGVEFANQLVNMNNTIGVTADQFNRLVGMAGLADDELSAVAGTMLRAIANGQDIGFTVQEINALFGDLSPVLAAFEGRDRAIHAAAQELHGLGAGIKEIDAEDAVGEISQLEEGLNNAELAASGFSNQLLKLTNPTFAAVDAFQSYQQALADAQEDGKLTADEQLDLAKALLETSAAFEAAGPNLSESIDLIAAASGQTREDVIADFEALGIHVNEVSEQMGSDLTDGLVADTKAVGDKLLQSWIDAIDYASVGVQKRYGISSPSKVMAKMIGSPLAEGIAMGFNDFDFDPSLRSLSDKIHKRIALETADLTDEVGGAGLGGVNFGGINVYNPIGEPTEESLAGAALSAAVGLLVR